MTKPVISLIAAMAQNRCIGIDNTLPWHISADLKRFKALTTGKPVVMGRKTFDSLGRPLPNRLNIVISRGPAGAVAENVVYVPSLEEALSKAGEVAEIMIIGGAQIYGLALPLADRLYLTEVAADVRGDAFFPDFGTEWQAVEVDGPHRDEASGYAYSYKTYQKQ